MASSADLALLVVRKGKQNAISFFDACDRLAYFYDLAGSFVTDNVGEGTWKCAVCNEEVGCGHEKDGGIVIRCT